MVFRRETSAFAGAQEYIFKHALLREVTYESVLKRLRRVYHGLVADWLLEQGGERVEEITGLIADHLELAGRTAEAVDYLLQAGDRARGAVCPPGGDSRLRAGAGPAEGAGGCTNGRRGR